MYDLGRDGRYLDAQRGRAEIPGWALPMAGGVLFAILMVLWLTSAFWLFATHGMSL